MNNYVNDFKNEIKIYFNDIKKLKPLTKEEEKLLFQKIKKGDVNARNKIIESNLKYVIKMAKAYKGKGVDFEDLISEGNIGLMKAMEKFDESNNVKFYSYGKWWVQASIQEAIKRKNISESNEILENDLITYDNSDINNEDSINSINYQNNKDNYDEFYADDNEQNIDMQLNKITLLNILTNILNDEEKIIINNYYGLNNENKSYTLEEIGKMINLTSERVRQKKEVILRKMRSYALANIETNNIYI